MDGNYRYSRSNAQRWGTQVDGPMACRATCPFKRFHEKLCLAAGKQMIGGKCWLEVAYARQLAESLCDEYELLVEHRPDELRPLLHELINVALIRERLHGRSNAAWELGPDYHELDLCFRQWTAAHNRHVAALKQIDDLCDEVKAELEDKYWRTKALSSCIGSKDIPEPYRTWAMERMAEYRRLQAKARPATA